LTTATIETEVETNVVNGKEEDAPSLCTQSISEDRRILVSKKAWAVRALAFTGMISLLLYNLNMALALSDPLIFYSILIPLQTLAVFFIGWLLFRDKAYDKIPKDLVSVIIPIYNQEALITDVIDAVFASTYPNIEIIAVNDGSKDDSGMILDALSMQYPKLKVIHRSNGGKRAAVATGFYASQGKFIVLIDSDSVIDEHAIEEFMKTFSADAHIGGMVGNAKVLNADKNFLTKLQDAWYDYAFNIQKTTESVFGTVLCCSGCLAAYRREAIARVIPFWAYAGAQKGDERDLMTRAATMPWVKSKIPRLSKKLMKSMASYDDSEDRSLTANTLIDWKTVYAPTAVAYTEVPENLKSYFRQQTRWKKGYIRSNLFVSGFFWKKNPVISMIFYTEFMTNFIAPVIILSILFYALFVLHQYLLPLTYIAGQLLIGLIAGLDYRFRDPTAKNWKYNPLMNLCTSFVLPWLIFPAVCTYRKNHWLTR
jgi:hyaluronan synthase